MSQDESEEFAPFVNRVAGNYSGSPSNILINKFGQILKPYKFFSNPGYDCKLDIKTVAEPSEEIPVTVNEQQFYNKIETLEDADFVGLRKLVPKYFGSKIIDDIDHIILEDLTDGMTYPCVMDLKISKDRNYPRRPPVSAKAKAAAKVQEDAEIKFPCLEKFSFCVDGFKLCNPQNGEVICHYMPKVTRQFSSEEVAEHMRKFLHFDEDCGKVLRETLLEGSEKILSWATSQNTFKLRASSLLLVYDAAGLANAPGGGNETLKARVAMIDFCHVFYSCGLENTNYVEGVKHVVHLLKTGNLPQ